MTESFFGRTAVNILQGGYGSYGAELGTMDREDETSLGSWGDAHPTRATAHDTPAEALHALAEQLAKVGNGARQFALLEAYRLHERHCDGEGKCHGPATWCNECGPVGEHTCDSLETCAVHAPWSKS
jgi:hypothetical protein